MWEAEPEPVVVGADRNGTTPAEETPWSHGHDDEAPETQQTLFSWAEFMAEPVKPKGRKSKAQAPSLSLFEWAVERELEAEPVGAGR